MAPTVRKITLMMIEPAIPSVEIISASGVAGYTLMTSWAMAEHGSRKFEMLPAKKDMYVPESPKIG